MISISAHPGDVELHAGAALGRLALEGARVVSFVCSDAACEGEGDPGVRRRETERAAGVLGIAEVIWAEPAAASGVATESLLRSLVREIRRNRPDLVLTHDPTTWWRRQGTRVRLGRADHREVGRAVLEAIHPRAALPAWYPELTARGLPAWLVRELWLFDTDEPDHFLDVAPAWELKVAALTCHASQNPTRRVEEAEADAAAAATGPGPGAETFRRLCLL